MTAMMSFREKFNCSLQTYIKLDPSAFDPQMGVKQRFLTHKGNRQYKQPEVDEAIQTKYAHLNVEPPWITSAPAAFEIGTNMCAAVQEPGEKAKHKPEAGQTYQNPITIAEDFADEDATVEEEDRKFDQAVGSNPEYHQCPRHLIWTYN